MHIMTFAPNACVTGIVQPHPGLIRLQVRMDGIPLAWEAGQYTFLGLDGAYVGQTATNLKLSASHDFHEGTLVKGETIRRPYSISSAMLAADGSGLLPQPNLDLEFYLRTDDSLFGAALGTLKPGNPLVVGPDVGGCCTLGPVPVDADVLLCATGTGEAPHNALVAALLQRGQKGRVASVVSCRQQQDMAYQAIHHRLAQAWQGYSHFAFATREGAHTGRHMQDLLLDGTLAGATGIRLEAGAVHVFLCGHPDMVGRPNLEDGLWIYPPGLGMTQLLAEHYGLQPGTTASPGDIHYDLYS